RWRAAPAPLLPLALGLAIGATSVARDAASLGEVSGCDRASATRSAGCFSPDQRATIAAAVYAGQRTPENAIILTAKEGTLGYYAHRRALLLGPALKMDSTRLLGYLHDQHVSYILLGLTQFFEPSLAAQLAGICGLQVAGQFPPHTYLLQVGADAPSDAGRTACQAIGYYLGARSSRQNPCLVIARSGGCQGRTNCCAGTPPLVSGLGAAWKGDWGTWPNDH
ncbi:MAG: hypothetical protein ACR2OG_10545, partial [Gemmatimonadaceae bacterium]